MLQFQVPAVESSTECSLLADVILTLYHSRSTRASQHAKRKIPSLGKYPRAIYTEPIRFIEFQYDLDHVPGEEVDARCPLCNLPEQTYGSGYSNSSSSQLATIDTLIGALTRMPQHILKPDKRGYPPRRTDVEDMANSLLAERNQPPVGKNWAGTFVKRRPELTIKFNRKYDYKRALCEDPEVIQRWFDLVANIKAKYGIQDDDTYNFDEAGFMMGVISTGAVVTASERRGRPKAVQPGNREWTTVIQGVNAKGWAIPPFIIFKARHHLSSWYKEEDLPLDWELGVSDNGWTTNKLGLDWLQHFDAHTKKRTVGTYRLLVIDGHESTTRSNSSNTAGITRLSLSICLLTCRTSCSLLMWVVLRL
jgi:hypothetical protein